MNDKKNSSKNIGNLALFMQLGFHIVSPILFMIWLTLWLKEKYALGDWIVLLGIIIGLLSAFSSVWNFAKKMLKNPHNHKEHNDDE